jgi:disulfide oxidoreductase YuzD
LLQKQLQYSPKINNASCLEISTDTLVKVSNTIHRIFRNRKCTKLYVDILAAVLTDKYKRHILNKT